MIMFLQGRSLFRVACKQQSADITIISLRNGRAEVVTKQPQIDPKSQKSAVPNILTVEAIERKRKRLRDLDNNVPRAQGFFCGQRQSDQSMAKIKHFIAFVTADFWSKYSRYSNFW
jgi:hypothetical protein